jgi:hypothetical protein
MNLFLWGAITATSLVAGLFFLRFWVRTRDRLFLFFFLAFWVFAVNWMVVAWLYARGETDHRVYFIRLLAFGLILAGIVDKNRRS